MKTKLFSLLVSLIIASTATMVGQNPIPNASFESWSQASPDLPENPDNWHTSNRPGNPNITPSDESAEGSLSARLEVKEVPVVGGLPASLEVYHNNALGFPVTDRHAALTGFYKLYTGSNGATVSVEIKMKKGDELIGSANWNTNYSASTFSNFYLPIIYSSGATPDRCFITLKIGPNAGSKSAGGVAWVDDLDLTEALEPALLLHSPNGKENWFAGDKQNIIWESQGIEEVKIEYTTDNGSTWLIVADKVSASSGSYEWTIPNTPSETCKVRVSDANNASFKDISDAHFSIIDPEQAFLFLTTPSGGIIWEAATQESIIWQSVNITNVKIEYTHDGGSSWTEVVASTAAAAGTYLWTVPNTPSTNCKVRISDASNAATFDTSRTAFTIRSATVSNLLLTNPSSGDNLMAGSAQNITWTGTGVVKVNIDFITGDGSIRKGVATSIDAALGTFAWTVPDSILNDCHIFIYDVTDPSVHSINQSPFTISGSLNLTSPVGGEIWEVGSKQNITWTSAGVDKVKLEYSSDNKSTWVEIVSSTEASAGSYSWTVPDAVSATCFVRVSYVSDNSLNSISAAAFSIAAAGSPVIVLTSPTGGEDWTVGTMQNITWLSYSVTDVKLEYSSDDKANWIEIIASTPESAGTYAWTIPNAVSTTCYVRISDASNGTVNDTTETAFTISAAPNPVVILSAPDGGEDWTVGTRQNITWTSSDIVNVKLEYSSDNKASWKMILGSTTASTGTYTWAIPNAVSANCFVRISDALNSSVGDTSTAAFTISVAPIPVLTLSSPAGGENWTVGTIQNITWTSADVTDVKLEYSSDDKSTWEEIIASTMASAGSYSWTVPDAVSTNCFVRVSDVSNSSLNDMNETPFEISKPTTSIDDLGSDSFNLTSYPNPFSEGTTISYQLSVVSDVRINIISSVGKVVESILLNNSNVGINEYYLDASEYAEGLYYILLNNNDNVLSTHKVLLIRSK